MRNLKRSIVIISLLMITLSAFSQKGLLTIDDIYLKGTYRSSGYGPVKWTDNGGYTTLERAGQSKGTDIVRYDAKTGSKSILVSASELVPQGEQSPLWIQDYSWSADGSKLMIFTNTKRVWRYNTKGDYWIFSMTAKKAFKTWKRFRACIADVCEIFSRL